MGTSPTHQPSKNNSGSSCSNLTKRKTVFCLHDELQRSPLINVIEEISDTDRITSMCMSTLSSMMGSGKYRKFLYPVNNNVLSYCGLQRLSTWLLCMNVSNNADFKKKQLVEKVIGRTMTSRTAILDINHTKDKSSKTKDLSAKLSQTRHKIEGLQESSRFDKMDKEADERYGHSSSFEPKAGHSLKRKDSARPADAKFPLVTRTSMIGRELQLQKFTLGERVEESQSDNDLAAIANVHLSKREQALKLLAEIQFKMEKRQKTDDDEDSSGGRRSSHPISPEEALHCAWLRLSKAQITTLEELIKQQGKDPGIHAHSDVTNYDVFAEIREIRNKENVLKEEDEYKKN